MQYFEVDTDLLRRDVKELEGLIAELKTKMAEMLDGVTALDVTWEGAAKTTYQQQFALDYKMLEEYMKEVQILLEGMEYAAKAYDVCENAAIDAIRRIPI